MNLHIQTLAIAAFVVSLALTVALTTMGVLLKGQPGLRKWILALWLAAFGSVLLGMRGMVPQTVPILGGQLMLALSAAFTWMGMAEFCGRRPEFKRVLAFTLLYLGVHAFFLRVHPSPDARSINYAFMSTSWNLAIAWTLLRHGPKELSWSTRCVAVLFLADTTFGTGVLAARLGALQAAQALEAIQFLEALVVGTLEVLGLALLLSHRLLAEVERTARTDGLTGILNRRALDEEADRLRGLVATTPVQVGGIQVPITVSMGVAVCLGDGLPDFPATCEQADKGLYLAKERGRNRVEMA